MLIRRRTLTKTTICPFASLAKNSQYPKQAARIGCGGQHADE
jgi:hypothetical protein